MGPGELRQHQRDLSSDGLCVQGEAWTRMCAYHLIHENLNARENTGVMENKVQPTRP